MLIKILLTRDMQYFALVTVFALTSAHKITELYVPLYADPRHVAELGCYFQMENEILHSVKWYRDVDEILRYNPSQKPPLRFFNVSGVTVQGGYCRMNRCLVNIMPQPVAIKTAFTCEISTEGPKFQIARRAKYMTIVAMPEKDPVIIEPPDVVKAGDTILLNCSSDYSLPPADINWYINEILEKQESRQYTVLGIPEAGGLQESWKSLRLIVPEAENELLRVRCEASLPVDPPVRRDTSTVLRITSQAELSKYVANTGIAIKDGVFLTWVILVYILIQLDS